MNEKVHVAGEGSSKLEIDMVDFRPIPTERVIQALEEDAKTKIVGEMASIVMYHRAQILAEEIAAHIKPTQDDIARLRGEVPESAAKVAQSQAKLNQVRQDLYREQDKGALAHEAIVDRLQKVEKKLRSAIVYAKSNRRSTELRYQNTRTKLDGIRRLVRSLKEVPEPKTELLDIVLGSLR